MEPVMNNILRAWTFWIRTPLREECREYLERTKLKELAAAPGSQRAAALFRDLGDGTTEVVVVSVWDSVQSIRAFVGDDYLKPTTVRLNDPSGTRDQALARAAGRFCLVPI